MNFPYRWHALPAPDGDDLILLPRPEIPIVVQAGRGSKSLIGLVDTGSDHTILPHSVAKRLGIATAASDGLPARAFGGEIISLLWGEVVLQLLINGETLKWRTEVVSMTSLRRRLKRLFSATPDFSTILPQFSMARMEC